MDLVVVRGGQSRLRFLCAGRKLFGSNLWIEIELVFSLGIEIDLFFARGGQNRLRVLCAVENYLVVICGSKLS